MSSDTTKPKRMRGRGDLSPTNYHAGKHDYVDFKNIGQHLTITTCAERGCQPLEEEAPAPKKVAIVDAGRAIDKILNQWDGVMERLAEGAVPEPVAQEAAGTPPNEPKWKHWCELVEEIRTQHNGVFGVRLFFGHDGHNVCRFDNYEECIVQGESGVSMQEAVEHCIAKFSATPPQPVSVGAGEPSAILLAAKQIKAHIGHGNCECKRQRSIVAVCDELEGQARRITQLEAEQIALKEERSRLETDLKAAREEIDQWKRRFDKAEAETRAARFIPTGDNHHNAAKCPYCQPMLEVAGQDADTIKRIANRELAATRRTLATYKEALRKAAEEAQHHDGDIFHEPRSVEEWMQRWLTESQPQANRAEIDKSFESIGEFYAAEHLKEKK